MAHDQAYRQTRSRCALAVVLVALLALAWPAGAQAQTVVSLTFDDGIATQTQVRSVLASHAMHGTFYINSGNIEAPDNPYYMAWSDVAAIAADGNEIAGHTLTHQRLTSLTGAQQRAQICDDAANLRARGYAVTNFAYPFGAGGSDSNVRSLLQECGYLSARNLGDLDCSGCPFAEQIPPVDPLGVRTPDWLARSFTLSDLQGWVTAAESHGGGWVPIVFHDICNSCDEGSVTLSIFTSFLDWLQPRAANGTVVKTVRDVIGSPPGYARPKGATPVLVSLVPAYAACTNPNESHGGALAGGSCNAPTQTSGELTVGTLDANGSTAKSVGSLRLDAVVGDPATSADEADAAMRFSLTDVRRQSTLSDYAGELRATITLRITDRNNGSAQSQQAATVTDLPFGFTIPCSATSDPDAGATCAATTSADAVTPGSVPEGMRTIWQVAQIQVLDGGPDGIASTSGNGLFAVQGLFVP